MSKKIKLYYNELEHVSTQGKGFEVAGAFNKSIEMLNGILKTNKVTDFKEFRKNPQAETERLLRETYAPIFSLGLDYAQSVAMLQIDLKPLNALFNQWQTSTPFVVCSAGNASPCLDKEPYTLYATTDLHFERLALCEKVIALIHETKPFIPYFHLGNIGSMFRPMVYFEPLENDLVPNHNFILAQ